MAAIPNDDTLKQDVDADLHNKDPAFVSSAISMVVGVLQAYGWFVLVAAVLVMYAVSRLKPKLQALRQSAADSVFKKSDVNAASERAEAMARARQKMQEELDRKAEVAKQKQAEKDEKKRLEKIENHDLAMQGKSKLKPKDDSSETPKSGLLKSKKPLKSEYSPLMGGGASCAYRPGRRMPSAGGG